MKSLKSLLAKIALRRFVGLYLGEHEVSASEVAVTPLGPVEITTRTEPCPPSELINVIESILPTMKGRRLQVGVGVPSSRVFYGTLALRGGADPAPESVMQKLLCSSDIAIDELTIDLVKTSVEKAPVASVAACRKKYMAAVLAALDRCNARVVRTEPVACAMVRVAMWLHRPPRRAKALVHVFLGEKEGLAVLTLNGFSLGWRQFALPEFSEGMAILSGVRTLLSQSQYFGMDSPPDHVIVYGRPDMHESLQKDGIPTEIGVRMLWHADPGYTGPNMALGLSLACLPQNVPTFDLSRWMKSRASLRDIFPWGELAAEAAVLVGMTMFLTNYSESIERDRTRAQNECHSNKVLALSKEADLKTEKKELSEKLSAVQAFLDMRLSWAGYIHDTARLLPNNIQLNEFQGASALGLGKTGSSVKKQTLTLAAMAPSSANGAAPPEAGEFVESLRKHPQWMRDFPKVDLTKFNASKAKSDKDKEAMSGFTIECRPNESAKGKK